MIYCKSKTIFSLHEKNMNNLKYNFLNSILPNLLTILLNIFCAISPNK